jgi:hypothetical protein
VSRLPIVRRDMAVVVDDSVPAQRFSRRCRGKASHVSTASSCSTSTADREFLPEEKPCDSCAYAGY